MTVTFKQKSWWTTARRKAERLMKTLTFQQKSSGGIHWTGYLLGRASPVSISIWTGSVLPLSPFSKQRMMVVIEKLQQRPFLLLWKVLLF